MKTRICILFFIVSLFTSINVFTQTWKRYTTADGLADNTVNFVTIDKNKTLWFCTDKGLSKFNGTTWNTYTTPDSLGGNRYYSLLIDPKNNFLISSEGYLLKFNGSAWSSYKLNKSYTITNVVKDTKDSIWISLYGGWEILKLINDSTWKAFSINNNFGNCMAIDKDDNKWVGTENGISVINSANVLKAYTTSDGLAGNSVVSIAIDNQGKKWFGTYTKGASVLDGTTWKSFSKTDNGLGGNTINTIFVASDNSIWFGHENGVSRYDGSAWKNYSTEDLKNVISINIDPDGNKWFGTRGNGIFKLTEASNEIVNNQYSNIYIYPVPARDLLYLPANIQYYSISDLNGKTVSAGKVYKNSIDVSKLNSGLYLIELNDGSSVIVKKFIKE